MDLNKFSYSEDIWKLRFNMEKCKVLHIGSRNIKIEHKLGQWKITKGNEKCDLGVGFDDSFKVDNHISSIHNHFKGGKCCFKYV